MLKKLLFVSENTGDLLKTLEDFVAHIDSVHTLETFYGDTTLQNLIRHSRAVVQEIKEYSEIYVFTNEDMELEYEEEEEEEQ